jgi:hypothetical protein
MASRLRNRLIMTLTGAGGIAALAVAGVSEGATTSDNSAPYSTSTLLTHQINYPRFLRFRVGPAAAGVALVSCDMSTLSASLGDGSDLACAGGDLGGGASTVEVKSNAGQIRLSVTTSGALRSGLNTIPYSEITTASTTPNLPAPVLPATGGTSPSVNVVLNAGNVTDRSATWTYTYNNTAVYLAGTYGGVNAGNGRVTYTVSSP